MERAESKSESSQTDSRAFDGLVFLNTGNQLGGSGAWGARQKRTQCHRSVIGSFNQHSRTANTLFISQTLAHERGLCTHSGTTTALHSLVIWVAL